MKSVRITLIVVAVALLALATRARADSIGPSCTTCQGSIYTLLNLGEVSSTATTETFRIELLIDTSGYNGGGSFLDSVSVKVAPNNATATIFDAPGGAGAWTEFDGGLNAGGCSGAGGGFVCASDAQSAPVPNLTAYAWIFDITIPTGTLFTGANQSSIKARYSATGDVGNNQDKVGDLVSENITLQPGAVIPEPGSVVLLGSGLAALGLFRRRRRSA